MPRLRHALARTRLMNLMLQLGIGTECQSLLELVSARHAKFCEKHEAAYYDDTELFDASRHIFWQKWLNVQSWLEAPGIEVIVAADADVIWQDGSQNIFNALPKDQFIGVTHIHGIPSAGVIWFRNAPETHRFVQKVLDLEERFKVLAGHDQSAMVYASKELAMPLYRIEDRFHGESETSILRGFHRLRDQRSDLMHAAIERLNLMDATRSRKSDASLPATFASRFLQFGI